MSTPHNPRIPHEVIPAERCYWALLDTSRLPATRSKRRRREQLLYLLEDRVPVSLSELHAVFVETDDAHIVACGAPVEDLQDALDGGALELTPDNTPEFVTLQAGRFRLLTGAMTPEPIRSWRSRTRAATLILTAGVLAVFALGLHRRAQQEQSHAWALTDAISSMYAEVLPGEGGRGGSQPPEIRLVSELRTLRKTRRGDHEHAVPSAAADMEQLLRAWPQDIHARTEFVSVASSVIQIRTVVDDARAAEEFAAAFDAISGWDPAPARITRSRGELRTSVQLSRLEDAP